MLDCFSFLGEDKAKEIVVTNTNKIASLIGDVRPIKDDLYTPKIEGADDEIRDMSYIMARRSMEMNYRKLLKLVWKKN